MALQTDANNASASQDELAEFRDLSRQILYMALLDNEASGLSSLNVDIPGASDLLARFGQYLYEQMAGQFPSPDELTVDEWAARAEQVAEQNELADVEYKALADRLYQLLKRELKLEQERLARRRY